MRRFSIVFVSGTLNLALMCGIGSTSASETPPLQASLKQVFDASQEIARKNGFTVELADLSRGRIESEWRVEPGVHWQQGRRERLIFKAWETEKGIIASIDVRREINDNSMSPSRTSDASWAGAGNNIEMQDRFVLLLRQKFDPEWKLQ